MIDNIKADRTAEDLLFQVLLDLGIDLTLKITRETITDCEVFFVEDNTLAARLAIDGKITEDFCKQLATCKPQRVVFRDASCKDDSMKVNVVQIFKFFSPSTDIKTL